MSDPEQQILDSWKVNAAPWTQAIRNQEIASRKLVTDAAIIAAIKARCPATVLDIGCGEGWLARRLAEQGMRVTGVDAIPALIDTASAAGGANYHLLSYQQLAAGELRQRFDVLVCNFSLLGETSVEGLLAGLHAMLSPGGRLMIQTLHPTAACGDQPYQDGWREGNWHGFSDAFSHPAPWYFRTLAGWLELFAHTGWQCERQIEPAYQDGRLASVIFVLAPS